MGVHQCLAGSVQRGSMIPPLSLLSEHGGTTCAPVSVVWSGPRACKMPSHTRLHSNRPTTCPPTPRPHSFYKREQRRQGSFFKWSGLTKEQASGRGSGGAPMQLAPGKPLRTD